MSKLSIEYAHIYTNQHISDEHKLSLEVLGKLQDEAIKAGDEMSLVVMVDDYSFPDVSFNYHEFLSWLEAEGYKPDIIIRESQLIPLCDEVLNLITDDRLKSQITDYIKAKKYPCSLFIATWYLLRAGKLTSTIFPKNLAGDKLINILPESFKPFEDKGLGIISSTPHHEVVQSIEYRFLEGRLIA